MNGWQTFSFHWSLFRYVNRFGKSQQTSKFMQLMCTTQFCLFLTEQRVPHLRGLRGKRTITNTPHLPANKCQGVTTSIRPLFKDLRVRKHFIKKVIVSARMFPWQQNLSQIPALRIHTITVLCGEITVLESIRFGFNVQPFKDIQHLFGRTKVLETFKARTTSHGDVWRSVRESLPVHSTTGFSQTSANLYTTQRITPEQTYLTQNTARIAS